MNKRDKALLSYFDCSQTQRPSTTRMNREAWLDARFDLLTALWHCSDAELEATARRWLAMRENPKPLESHETGSTRGFADE